MHTLVPTLYSMSLDDEGNRVMDDIAVNSIVRACHLIGVYGTTPVPDISGTQNVLVILDILVSLLIQLR